jgi:hypothetical protein
MEMELLETTAATVEKMSALCICIVNPSYGFFCAYSCFAHGTFIP